MKKKKSMIFLALLVAVFVLGVGYAAVTGVDLSISGTASTETKDLQVFFDGTKDVDVTHIYNYNVAPAATGTGTVTAKTRTGEFTVTNMKKIGDYAVATFGIKNYETDLDAEIKEVTASVSKSEFFEVETNFDSANATTLEAGDTTNLVITVRLKKLPITDADSTTTVTVELHADPAQPA